MISKNHVRGFTTLELIVTLVLVGILAAVALPRMGLVGALRGPAFRDQLLASLQYARKTAVAARRYVCVGIAGNNVTFKLDTNEPDDPTFTFPLACAATVALPVPGRDCNPSTDNKVCAPTGIGLAVSNNVALFVFDAAGRSLNTDGTSLATATFTISDADGNSTITVEKDTGYVH